MEQTLPTVSIAVIAADRLRHRCLSILADADDVCVVGWGLRLAHARHLLGRHRPDVLLLDAGECPGQALGMLAPLRRLSPRTAVILLRKKGFPTSAVLDGVRRGAWGHSPSAISPAICPRPSARWPAARPGCPAGSGRRSSPSCGRRGRTAAAGHGCV